MEAATICLSRSWGYRPSSSATMLRKVFPVEISSSTKITVSVAASHSGRRSPGSFCSTAWLCSSRNSNH